TGVTYSLTVAGLTGLGTSLAPSVFVGAGQTVTTPLNVTVPAGAIPGTAAFQVFAQSASGAIDSVEGELIVSADVTLPTRGVHLTLTPETATVGQGDTAHYTLTLTNIGDTTDTYSLSGLFPANFAASFSQTTITTPPGESNFRNVELTLTPPVGT